MEKQIKEAIEIISKVRETMPECTNKAFLKGALNELNEALSKAKVFSSNAVLKVTSDSIKNKREREVAVAFADWLINAVEVMTEYKTTKQMFEEFKKAKATDF